MICSECTRKAHARGLCSSHYTAWYRKHGQEAKKLRAPAQRKWKFKPKHWFSWLEARTPDIRTLELREGIQTLRHTLP